MNLVLINGIRLGIEQLGNGPPLILVHGSWTNRSTWDPVFRKLAEHFCVIRYDRRGYGESEKPGAPPAVHAEDLRGLINTLGLGKVALVGNSMGALIVMHAAASSKFPLSFVIVHEPPLLGMLDEPPAQTALSQRIRSALARAAVAGRAGDWQAATRHYVEGSSGIPGIWQYMPEEQKQSFIEHAPPFLDESSDEAWCHMDLAPLRTLAARLIITTGSVSSPFLRIIAERLGAVLPDAQRRTFQGAGHVAHQSAPALFVDEIVKQAARG
jgi:pimeloyl-ACP methyl ester carboxylesterase